MGRKMRLTMIVGTDSSTSQPCFLWANCEGKALPFLIPTISCGYQWTYPRFYAPSPAFHYSNLVLPLDFFFPFCPFNVTLRYVVHLEIISISSSVWENICTNYIFSIFLLIDSVVLMNTKANSKEYNFRTVLKRTLLINIENLNILSCLKENLHVEIKKYLHKSFFP